MLKSSSSDLKYKIGHKYSRADEDETEKHKLLPGIEFTEVNGVQASSTKLVTSQVDIIETRMYEKMEDKTHASVMALTQRKSESVKGTGVEVEEAQNMTAARRHVKMK